MNLRDVMFSVNDYDRDGDIVTEGIFIHIGDHRLKVADTLDGFVAFADHLHSMVPEIKESYAREIAAMADHSSNNGESP